MSSVGHLPVHFTSIDECPKPFREPLKGAINSTDTICDIIYSPAFVSGKSSLLGSVFCVTDREWLIVQELKKKNVGLFRAVHADTLLIELTDILLYGQLKIDYAFNEQSNSGICFFNTVSEEMYTKAIYRVLNLMEGVSGPAGIKDRTILTYLESWPLKFRNYGWDFLPPGCCLLEGINWPTIIGRFRHELGPGIALFLTDRHLVVVADEPSRSWFVTDHVNVGVIVTFVPRNRISGFHIQKHNRFHILELQVNTARGGKCFRVRFPPAYQEEVVELASKVAPDDTQCAANENGESPM